MTDEPHAPLGRLVGTWTTEATHPAMPGVVVPGTSVFEWLEGERFLMYRGRSDHADFPNFVAILGVTDTDRVDSATSADAVAGPEPQLSMHYFDSRGVFRVYETELDEHTWRVWRSAPGFSQRFTGTISGDGDTIEGRWQLSTDDATWDDDVQITYQRQR